MNESSPKNRLKFFIAIPVLLVVAASWPIINRYNAVPCTIFVNGAPAVNVESMRTAKGILESVRLEKANGIPSESIRLEGDVALRSASKGSAIVDVPEAIRDIEKLVTVEADLYAINVDGKPIVAFAEKRDADETLDLAKAYYEKQLSDKRIDSTFKENVFVEKRYVPIDKLRSTPDEALGILTSVSEKETVHMVQRGDRVIKLSQKYNVWMDDLKRLNPGMNFDRLSEGDRLIIKPAVRPITVISKAVVTKTEDVAPPSKGRYRSRMKSGKRQMQLLVTYENGQPVSSDIISQITTWNRPTDRRDENDSGLSNKRRFRHRTRANHRRSSDKPANADVDSGLGTR